MTTKVNIKLVVYFSSLITPCAGLSEFHRESWAQKATYRTCAIVTRVVSPVCVHAHISSYLWCLWGTSCICSPAAAGEESPTLPSPIPKIPWSSKAATASLVLVSSSSPLVPLSPSTPSCPSSCFSSATFLLLFLCCFAFLVAVALKKWILHSSLWRFSPEFAWIRFRNWGH